jgi:hypothetical protein
MRYNHHYTKTAQRWVGTMYSAGNAGSHIAAKACLPTDLVLWTWDRVSDRLAYWVDEIPFQSPGWCWPEVMRVSEFPGDKSFFPLAHLILLSVSATMRMNYISVCL